MFLRIYQMRFQDFLLRWMTVWQKYLRTHLSRRLAPARSRLPYAISTSFAVGYFCYFFLSLNTLARTHARVLLRFNIIFWRSSVAVRAVLHHDILRHAGGSFGSYSIVEARRQWRYDRVRGNFAQALTSEILVDDGTEDLTVGTSLTPLRATDEGKIVTGKVSGVILRVKKLVMVVSLSSKHVAETGDVVIGRPHEWVGNRWRIDINVAQHSVLLFSAVNLPGDIKRRQTY